MKWLRLVWHRVKFLIGKIVGKISLHGPGGSEISVDVDEVVSIDFDESTCSIIVVERGKEPKYLPMTDWNIHFAATHGAHLIERMKKSVAKIKKQFDPSHPNLPNQPSTQK